jgi:hypothetical protein
VNEAQTTDCCSEGENATMRIMKPTPVEFRARPTARGVIVAIALGAVLGGMRVDGAAQLGGGVLSLETTASVLSDSNVFGDTTDQHDTIYSLRPELRYVHEGSRGSSNLSTGVDISRYDEFSSENSDDWFANAGITIPDSAVGILSGDLHLAYFNGRESEDFIGERVDIKRLDFGLNANFDLTAKSGLRTGVARTTYDPEGRTGSHSNSGRIGVFTRLRPELSGFLDYTRNSAKSDADAPLLNRIDTRSDNISVGLQGQLSPFVQGSVSVGSERTKSGSDTLGGTDTSFVSDVGLTWKPRPSTSLGLSAGRGNRITAASQSIDSKHIALSLHQEITVKVSATASVAWESYNIRGIANSGSNRLVADLDVSYAFSDRLSAGAKYSRHSTNSYLAGDDTSRTTLGLFATLKL